MKHQNYIGIDPDTKKSGVAFYETKSKKLELSNLTFFNLFDYLKFVKEKSIKKNQSVKIIIDAGWLNKSNFHVTGSNIRVNGKIGERTGANHEVGKKIIEMCEYLELDFELHKPKKSKVNAEMFAKITGTIGRTNQEQRDAGMLVYGK